MCGQSCRGVGTLTGSGNMRITPRVSNQIECQVSRATRTAILTAILMSARGRNSTPNGRPDQAPDSLAAAWNSARRPPAEVSWRGSLVAYDANDPEDKCNLSAR